MGSPPMRHAGADQIVARRDFGFNELEAMQREIAALRIGHADSLAHYHNAKLCGFWHRYKEVEQNDFSKACTATCVLSLVAAGLWTKERPWFNQTNILLDKLLHVPDWTSAGLPKNNPFTVSFLLEAAQLLGTTSAKDRELPADYDERVTWAISRLNQVLLHDERDSQNAEEEEVADYKGAVRGAAHIT